MKKKIFGKKILEFRRSWDIRPEPLNKTSPYHPLNIKIYENIPKKIFRTPNHWRIPLIE